jgi:TPR repeat protein
VEGLQAEADLIEWGTSMMKRVLAACLLVLWIGSGNRSVADDKPVMGNAPFIIAPDDLEAVEKQALEGSSDAALRLYQFYRKVVLNEETATYWAQIAAENGNVVGQYAFGLYLLERDDSKSALRARYWLGRAADQGNPRARSVLERLKRERGR